MYMLQQAQHSKGVCDYVYCDDVTSSGYTSNASTRYRRNSTLIRFITISGLVY